MLRVSVSFVVKNKTKILAVFGAEFVFQFCQMSGESRRVSRTLNGWSWVD